jgi:glycerol-3-phosphate dehydrogenase
LGSLAAYGSDSVAIQEIVRDNPSMGEPLHPALPYCGAEVVWAVRAEMAWTVEDVLARRTRALFLNARAASEMAARVAAIMAPELRQTNAWQLQQVNAFQQLARDYMMTGFPVKS